MKETQDNSDRIYGAGSRLERSGIDLKEKRNSFQGGYGRLITKGSEYFYDEEGNLAKKTEPNGATWTYFYFGNGMLKKVIKPDRSSVSFKYDPLGRRIEKSVTKAGSEDVSKLEETAPALEESAWETVGGVRIRRTNTEMNKPHVVKGSNQSIYGKESNDSKQLQEKEEKTEKVIRFLWNGNTLLHEWEEDNTANRIKPKYKVDYKADFVIKLEKQEEEKSRQEAERGQSPPDSLITWIFQDDFILRGKITKDGNYSIISDYLGTPVEAYDEEGNKVWERELDVYGRVKTGRKDIYGRTEKEIGEKNFIPFRFQGQYEDEEIGLYYNRFRYYSPEDGCYTQQDPIGLAGGNPTLYGYVFNPTIEIDVLGLDEVLTELIHFMQSSIKNQTGSYTVLGNAEALKNGTLLVSDLPLISVWKDSSGKIWTLDHRRLAAFKEAGIKEIPVDWASEQTVKKQMWKMTTKNEGKSITLKMEDGTKRTIDNSKLNTGC